MSLGSEFRRGFAKGFGGGDDKGGGSNDDNAQSQLTIALQAATSAIVALTRTNRASSAPGRGQGGAGAALVGGASRLTQGFARGMMGPGSMVGMGLSAFGRAGPMGAALGIAAEGGKIAGRLGEAYASNAAITGDHTSAMGSTAREAQGILGSVPLLGAMSGFKQADQVLSRSEGRLSGLADMARQGISIDDGMIQRELDIVIQQEKRAQNVEARTTGFAGAKLLEASSPDSPLHDLVDTVRKILGMMEGGSSR